MRREPRLIEWNGKKIKELKRNLTPEEHAFKKNGLPKWRRGTKSDNPDLGAVEGQLVVRLDAIHTREKAEELLHEVGLDIYEDDGTYWGAL